MSASARQRKHEELREAMLWKFHFHSVLADIDIVCGRYGACCSRYGLWLISFVADMVVSDMVCGRYRRFPASFRQFHNNKKAYLVSTTCDWLLANMFSLSHKKQSICQTQFFFQRTPASMPRWLSWLRHNAHRPGRSAGGAGVQSSGRSVDFVFGFQGRMLRLISWAGKEGSTVSSIICDCWLILS